MQKGESMRASYYIYWGLGILWMVGCLIHFVFGDTIVGSLDMIIGVLFLILAENERRIK